MNLIKEIMFADVGVPLIDRLKEFVSGCSYLCHHNTIDKVQAYISAGCNYTKTLELLSEPPSIDNLRTSIWYANQKLRDLLCGDILQRIKDDPELAEELIDWAIENPDDLVFNQVAELVPVFKHKRYDWNDCIAEIKFLKTYSYPTMLKRLEKLDKDKLSYIFHSLMEPSNCDVKLSVALKKNFTYSD